MFNPKTTVFSEKEKLEARFREQVEQDKEKLLLLESERDSILNKMDKLININFSLHQRIRGLKNSICRRRSSATLQFAKRKMYNYEN